MWLVQRYERDRVSAFFDSDGRTPMPFVNITIDDVAGNPGKK